MAKWSLKTDIGVVRSQNQDNGTVLQNDEGVILAIICDGMGGHTGGEHASEITIKTFKKTFANDFPPLEEPKKIMKWFYNSLKLTKKEMKDFAGDDPGLLDMGTTVSAAIIYPTKIYVYNVGDSRTYAFTEVLSQITVDHNIRNYYINEYGYSDEEAATVMGAAALTSALGPKKKTTLEEFIVPRKGFIKYIVLTTDGIHDYIEKHKFESVLSKGNDLDDIGNNLIKTSIKGKSSDNLTVILVDLKDGET